MKITLLTVAAALLSHFVLAQDFLFGKTTAAELELTKYAKDTSACAVVLNEFGTAFVSAANGNINFEYHVKIKIFNSKGFKYGTVEIPLRDQGKDNFETIRNIRGITFYKDNNGAARSSELESQQIFTERKAGKYHDLIKFALPNLKDGCVLEYSYTLESPFIFNFRGWEFQWDIPKIHSEYVPEIPAVYNYNILIRGIEKLSKNTGVLVKDCFTPPGMKADCSRMTYAMDDVPAFYEEEYMTAAKNFKANVHFELSDYTDFRGVKHKITKEWKDVDQDLRAEINFGGQLKKKDFFEDKIGASVQGKTSELEKAKAVYNFIKGWYKWDNYYGKYSSNGLKKAFESRTGNVGDINLSLVNALNAAGLQAEPVILSTRSNGLVNNLVPVLSEFDYVIGKVTIGESSYLLDATDPLLPFGLLPLRCINGRGRVISSRGPSTWIDLKASQNELEQVVFDLELEESGKIKGTLSVSSSGYAAYNKRKELKKFNSIEEYVENLDEKLPKVKITKAEVKNVDSLDRTMIEIYHVELSAADATEIYVNPYFMNKVSENPFKLAERSYPVDLGAEDEKRVTLRLRFPPKFELISKPEVTSLALPNNGGRFLTQIGVDDNVLTYMYYTRLSKSIYSSEEYPYLKELFNKIVQVQQTDLIFKKKI